MYLSTWKDEEWQIYPHLTVLLRWTPLHTSSFSSLSSLKMASLRLWVLQYFWLAKLWKKILVTDRLSLHKDLLWVNGACLFSCCSKPNEASRRPAQFLAGLHSLICRSSLLGPLAMEEQNPTWAHLLFYSLQWNSSRKTLIPLQEERTNGNGMNPNESLLPPVTHCFWVDWMTVHVSDSIPYQKRRHDSANCE